VTATRATDCNSSRCKDSVLNSGQITGHKICKQNLCAQIVKLDGKTLRSPSGESFVAHKKRDKSVRPLNKFSLLGKMLFLFFEGLVILTPRRRGKLCASEEWKPLYKRRNCAVNRYVCFAGKMPRALQGNIREVQQFHLSN
jgi:hypothetical protein